MGKKTSQVETPYTYGQVIDTARAIWQRNHPFYPHIETSSVPLEATRDGKCLTQRWFEKKVEQILQDTRTKRYKKTGVYEKSTAFTVERMKTLKQIDNSFTSR